MTFAAVPFLLLAFAAGACAETRDVLRHVDPFIGTGGTAHTSPAAACPFALVQAGPDTGNVGWDYCAGYRHADREIIGFSQTHLNGTGWMDLGDAMIMPVRGDAGHPRFPRSRFRHETERASPGFYRVTLDDANADVEVTASAHVACYTIRYRDSRPVQLLVDSQYGFVNKPEDLARRVLSADVRPIGQDALGGSLEVSQWVRRGYSFKAVFSRPFVRAEALPRRDPREKGLRHLLTFDLPEGEPLRVKVALSARGGLSGASRNLAAEVPDWDFAAVRSSAEAKWRALLSRVEIDGDAAQQRVLATALYHLFLQPNDLADAGEAPFYSTFSFWDTYRAAHPLYTLLCPERVPGMVDSIVRQARATGYLPIWPLWGVESQAMIGVHSIPVLVDAYLKGLRGNTDWNEVMDLVEDTLTGVHPQRKNEHRLLQDTYGYIPYDLVGGQGVSIVLEDRYDDACAARLAAALGRTARADFFRARAKSWRTVFDRQLGLVRGRDAKGDWRTPFDPYLFGHGSSRNNDFTEGNAWQWTWHVLHEPSGLVAAMGGREAALRRLDALFTAPSDVKGDYLVLDITGLIGQLVHGNEPSHHIPYFYSLLGERGKTAEKVGEICRAFYTPRPDGLCGNEDCGQMSAWYVFAVMGFYPFDPCGGAYVLGEPQARRVVVRLADGKRLTIEAAGTCGAGASAGAVRLNGTPLAEPVVRHADLVKGGRLSFEPTKGTNP